MTNADRILAFLNESGGPACDDCVSQLTRISPRQQVNSIASRLASENKIFRGAGPACVYCHLLKKVSSTNRFDTPAATLISSANPSSPARAIMEASPEAALATLRSHDPREAAESRAWHWEGNAQELLRRFLEEEGWAITSVANTALKETGVDLVATRGGEHLFVEVKGYPSTTYEYGPRRGERKPTLPSNQARQWYSHALLSVMRLRDKYPEAKVALCFPDFATYRRLIAATVRSLGLLRVTVYLVTSSGAIETLGADAK